MPTPADLPAELARQVVELYAEAERILLERTARALAKGLDSPDWVDKKLAQIRDYRRQVERLLAALDNKVPEAMEAALLEAYKRGGLEAVADAAKAGQLTEAAESLSGLRATETLQREALTNLAATHERILRTALDTYRSVVAETASQVLLGVETRRTACQAALDRFAKKGVTGFIDKAGRHWDLASYTEMAMRTATAHAAVQGHVDCLEDYGMDLVFVSDAPGECERCRPWEGKVLSSSGRDPKYPSLAEARDQGLFHPGCRHSVSAYFPGVTRTPKRTADPEGDRNRQKQRYLERQVRAAKRMEAAALDDTAKRKSRARVKAYQAKLREHVEETDGKRLYYREQIGKAH